MYPNRASYKKTIPPKLEELVKYSKVRPDLIPDFAAQPMSPTTAACQVS